MAIMHEIMNIAIPTPEKNGRIPDQTHTRRTPVPCAFFSQILAPTETPMLTFEKRAHLPYRHATETSELTNGQLHEEQRHAGENEQNEVRNQEGTWNINLMSFPPETITDITYHRHWCNSL